MPTLLIGLALVRHSWQASGITFPSAGCWEVVTSAGNVRLKFVVRVP